MQKMKKVTVGFRVVKTRPNKKEECPIFVRITKDGQRTEFSSGHYINPKSWCDVSQKVKDKKNPSTRAINEYIDIVKVKLLDICNKLSLSGETLSVIEIKEEFLGKSSKLQTLLSVHLYHAKQCEKLEKQGKFSVGRLNRYKVFEGKLINFLEKNYKLKDYNLSKLSPSFIAKFKNFLCIDQNLDIGTVGVYLKILIRLVNVAIENEWMKENPFQKFKIASKTVDRVKLESHEIKTIEEKVFLTDRLSMIRDVFLFCTYTGLAHSDVHKLNATNIVIGSDGKKWLSVKRTKTDVPCKIPLLEKAEIILEKYKNDPECVSKGKLLPVKANQKMNEYLKEIADLCGIRKHLTSHIARHTFATTVCSNNGISIETISKLLGHRSIRTTQIYAKNSDQRIADEFSKIKFKLDL